MSPAAPTASPAGSIARPIAEPRGVWSSTAAASQRPIWWLIRRPLPTSMRRSPSAAARAAACINRQMGARAGRSSAAGCRRQMSAVLASPSRVPRRRRFMRALVILLRVDSSACSRPPTEVRRGRSSRRPAPVALPNVGTICISPSIRQMPTRSISAGFRSINRPTAARPSPILGVRSMSITMPSLSARQITM